MKNNPNSSSRALQATWSYDMTNNYNPSRQDELVAVLSKQLSNEIDKDVYICGIKLIPLYNFKHLNDFQYTSELFSDSYRELTIYAISNGSILIIDFSHNINLSIFDFKRQCCSYYSITLPNFDIKFCTIKFDKVNTYYGSNKYCKDRIYNSIGGVFEYDGDNYHTDIYDNFDKISKSNIVIDFNENVYQISGDIKSRERDIINHTLKYCEVKL